MRNNYNYTGLHASKATFTFVIVVFFGLFVQIANAQTLYNTVSASQVNIPNGFTDAYTKSEGTYLIKDGELDDIYSLKLVLPTAQLKTFLTDSLIGKKKITFEQTRVMVLPVMGMVHFIGMLDVDGVRSTTSFQLGFSINSDQSITFKGSKLFKLSDFDENLPKEELKLDIGFVLKNIKNNQTVLKTKT